MFFHRLFNLPVGTLRIQSLDIQNFSRQGVSPTRFQFWNLEGEAENPDHVHTLITDKLTKCLPLGLVICDVPDVVVAEAAHGHVPELDVGASEAEAHVVQAERVQRRQPPRWYPCHHEAFQRLNNAKNIVRGVY